METYYNFSCKHWRSYSCQKKSGNHFGVPNKFLFAVNCVPIRVFYSPFWIHSNLTLSLWVIKSVYKSHSAIKSPIFETDVFSMSIIHTNARIYEFYANITVSKHTNGITTLRINPALGNANGTYVCFRFTNITCIPTDLVRFRNCSAELK